MFPIEQIAENERSHLAVLGKVSIIIFKRIAIFD